MQECDSVFDFHVLKKDNIFGHHFSIFQVVTQKWVCEMDYFPLLP